MTLSSPAAIGRRRPRSETTVPSTLQEPSELGSRLPCREVQSGIASWAPVAVRRSISSSLELAAAKTRMSFPRSGSDGQGALSRRADVQRQSDAREKRYTISEEIRRVLGLHARLVVDVAELGTKDDLFKLGMTSHASVSVMLALEDAFGVEFPEHMLRKSTFESISSIENAIVELLKTVPGD